MNTAHSASSLSPAAAGIRYVAARICLGGPAFHRAGMVHLTPAEPPELLELISDGADAAAPDEAPLAALAPVAPVAPVAAVGGWSGGSAFESAAGPRAVAAGR